MIADYQGLRESEGLRHQRSQEVFVEGEYEFPCANGSLRLPNRPRPSPIAEGDLEKENDVEFKDNDEKTKHNRRFVVL